MAGDSGIDPREAARAAAALGDVSAHGALLAAGVGERGAQSDQKRDDGADGERLADGFEHSPSLTRKRRHGPC